MRQKISAHVAGGPSGGSSLCRPGSEDPHRREQKFFTIVIVDWLPTEYQLPTLSDGALKFTIEIKLHYENHFFSYSEIVSK